MDFSEKNREVYLNFGLISWGPLSEIERLQAVIDTEFPRLTVVFQTATARRLYLKKVSWKEYYERENRRATTT
jgi:hypothetical protein